MVTMSNETGLTNIWNQVNGTAESNIEIRERTARSIKEESSSYPTTISVVSALDDLILCFAIGGQVKHYYRYGSYTTCERQRSKFWFALKNGTFFNNEEDETNFNDIGDLERKKKVQEFYKSWLLEDKAKGSSEDVWNERRKPLNSPFKE